MLAAAKFSTSSQESSTIKNWKKKEGISAYNVYRKMYKHKETLPGTLGSHYLQLLQIGQGIDPAHYYHLALEA